MMTEERFARIAEKIAANPRVEEAKAFANAARNRGMYVVMFYVDHVPYVRFAEHGVMFHESGPVFSGALISPLANWKERDQESAEKAKVAYAEIARKSVA